MNTRTSIECSWGGDALVAAHCEMFYHHANQNYVDDNVEDDNADDGRARYDKVVNDGGTQHRTVRRRPLAACLGLLCQCVLIHKLALLTIHVS